jgi:murein DD-endopeptidase MepM/ murein hydrolase activator NlpD
MLVALSVAAGFVAASPPASANAASGDVAALQVAMNALGLYPHPVDGIAGPWTTDAVRSFQAGHGLAVDGVAGPATRTALGRRGRPPLGSRTMSIGQRGWDIAALQFLLRSRGFDPGGVDGGLGPQTSNAIRRFQSAAGLAVDDAAGPATLAALRGGQVVTAPSDPVRFLRPLNAPMGDGFGWTGGRWHTGIDFPAPYGTFVGAAGRGVVSFAGWNNGGYGNLVVVSHRLGFESWYAHLSSISAWVGEDVVGGSAIGRVGSTGHSTGPHLHFEVRQFGTPIDPLPRLLDITAARTAVRSRSHRRCRPNADARSSRNVNPPVARLDRCP